MTRHCCAIGVLTVTFGVSTSSATEPTIPNPTFWCWSEPLGDAVANGHFLQTANLNARYFPGFEGGPGSEPGGGWTPTLAGIDAANWALDLADDMDLSGGDPFAIIIRSFAIGMGQPTSGHPFTTHYSDLTSAFRHWCDALPDYDIVDSTESLDPIFGDYWGPEIESCWNVDYDADAPDLYGDLEDTEAEWWWNTPWTTHGRNDVYDFMDAFVNQYGAQGTTYPKPYRIFFDVENTMRSVDSNRSASTHYDASAALYAFDIARDYTSRWGTLSVGIDGEVVYDGKDMYQLFDVEAPSEVKSYDETADWDDEGNWAWTIWYDNLISKIKDEVIRYGLTGPIEAARDAEWWPYVKSSNAYSAHVDDVEGYNYLPNGKVGVETWWVGQHPTSTTDLQSPGLYAVAQEYSDEYGFMSGPNNDDIWEASIRNHRHNLDLMIDSLDSGHDASEIVPWIQNIGVTGGPGVTFPNKHRANQLLSLLRSRGIKEIILWNAIGRGEPSSSQWSDMAFVQEQVWLYDSHGLTLNLGTEVSTSLTEANLGVREGSNAIIESEEYGGTLNVVELEISFLANDSTSIDSLQFYIEADLEDGSDVEVDAEVWDNAAWDWDAMDMMDYEYSSDDTVLVDDRKMYVWETVPANGTYIYGGGVGDLVVIKLTFSNSEAGEFTVRIDSAQLVEVE